MDISQKNKDLAKKILNSDYLDKNVLQNALQYCNKNRLCLEETLIKHKLISSQQLANLHLLSTNSPKITLSSNSFTDHKNNEPSQFGDYQIIREIARGGMGIVYEAMQKSINRKVALKVLIGEVHSLEKKRFLREAKINAAVQHQYIVPIYDMGEYNGCLYLAMKYIEGRTLYEVLREEKDLSLGMQIFTKVVVGVQYAHENQIIHRDLKPSNILVDINNHPYISDFGLAKNLDAKSSLTKTGSSLGTPFYMSPEQTMGKKLTYESDLYSLGVILYEILTSQLPFQAQNLHALYRKICSDNPTPPRKINADVTYVLDAVCMKCLAKKIHHRYKSAKELLADLEKAQTQKKHFASIITIKAQKIFSWYYGVALISIFLLAITTLKIFSQQSTKLENVASITSQSLWQQSQEYYQNKQYLKAYEIVTKDIQKAPSFEKYIFQLDCLIHEREYSEAKEKIFFIRQKYPQQHNILTKKEADLLFLTKSYGDALLLYKKIYDKTNITLALCLMRTYFYLKEYDLTLLHIPVEQNFDTAVKGEILHYHGGVLYHQRQFEKAKTFLEEAILLRKESLWETHYYLGMIFLEQDNKKEAIFHLQRAMLLNPQKDVDTLINLSKTYYESKDYQHALQGYTKALDISPWDYKIWYQRGMCYTALDDYQNAQRDFFKTLELKSDFHPSIMQLYENASDDFLWEKFKILDIVEGNLNILFDRHDVDLYHDAKLVLAQKIIENYERTKLEKYQNYNSELAQSFIDIIASDSAQNVKDIASKGLGTMYRNHSLIVHISEYLAKIKGKTIHYQIIKSAFDKIYKRYEQYQLIYFDYLVVRYTFLKDKTALKQIFDDSQAIFFIKKSAENRVEDIVKYWLIKTLFDLKTQQSQQVLHEFQQSKNFPLYTLANSVQKKPIDELKNLLRSKNHFLKTIFLENATSNINIKFLLDTNEIVKLVAAMRLWQMGNQQAKKILLENFRNDNEHKKLFAYKAFLAAPDRYLTPEINNNKEILLWSLRNSLPSIQKICLYNLGKRNDFKMVDLLKKMAYEKLEPTVKAHVLIALMRQKNFNIALEIVSDPKSPIIVKAALVYAVQNKIITISNPMHMLSASKSISVIETPHYVPLIGKFLGHEIGSIYISQYLDIEDIHVQRAAAYGAMLAHSRKLTNNLKNTILKTKDEKLQNIAAGVLFNITIRKYFTDLPQLEKWLQQQTSDVKKGAAVGYASTLLFEGNIVLIPPKMKHWDEQAFYQIWSDEIYHFIHSQVNKKKQINGIKAIEFYLSMLTKAIVLDPNKHEYHFVKAIALYYHKDYFEAAKEINMAIKLKPDLAVYYRWLAKIAVDLLEYNLAYDALEKSLSLDPWNLKTQQLYVICLEKLNKQTILESEKIRLRLLED